MFNVLKINHKKGAVNTTPFNQLKPVTKSGRTPADLFHIIVQGQPYL